MTHMARTALIVTAYLVALAARAEEPRYDLAGPVLNVWGTADGQTVVGHSAGGRVASWDWGTGRERQNEEAPGEAGAVAFAPSGRCAMRAAGGESILVLAGLRKRETVGRFVVRDGVSSFALNRAGDR